MHSLVGFVEEELYRIVQYTRGSLWYHPEIFNACNKMETTPYTIGQTPIRFKTNLVDDSQLPQYS